MLHPGTVYKIIYFSGTGFMLPYQLGAIQCMFDNNISCVEAYGLSGGAMSSTCMLLKCDTIRLLHNTIEFIKKDDFHFFSFGSTYRLYEKYVLHNLQTRMSSNFDNNHIILFLLGKGRVQKTAKNIDDLVKLITASGTIVPLFSLLPAWIDNVPACDAFFTREVFDKECDIVVKPAHWIPTPHCTNVTIQPRGCINPFWFLKSGRDHMIELYKSGYTDTLNFIQDPYETKLDFHLSRLYQLSRPRTRL